MKAIRIEQFGDPSVMRLAEVPDLQPAAGQVLVRIEAAGVNPVDTYIRSGAYGKLPDLPYTPGHDGAGVVEVVGEGVQEFSAGDRVYVAGSLTGTYAEQCLCVPSQVHRLPNNASAAEGASLGIPYATAFRALFQRGSGKFGETVLIHGGTGGVGTAAVQLARAAGMRVFATGGTDVGRLLLQEQGAECVFDHHEVGYLERIRDAAGSLGIDLILEMLANVNLAHDLTLLSKTGRVVVIGSRGSVEINPRDAMAHDTDIRGLLLFNTPAEELAAIHRGLIQALELGIIRPVVGKEVPLAEAPRAHELVMSPGAHGKVILTAAPAVPG